MTLALVYRWENCEVRYRWEKLVVLSGEPMILALVPLFLKRMVPEQSQNKLSKLVAKTHLVFYFLLKQGP